ncbi:DUF4301 family protein [Flavobacterium rhizosphaerae]|uniref:DUF4301 family protein n=1 Tax=Flavobacterium rhizosphaerae TaxID=3163298 RepID=A0ABW8YZB9_9FLAO
MEENFTQQRTRTINITIYTEGDSKQIAADLSKQTFAEEKDNRILAFKGKNIEDVTTIKPCDLAIIIAAEDNKKANELSDNLRKEGNLRIRVTRGLDNMYKQVTYMIIELEKALELGLLLTDYVQVYRRNIPMYKIESQLKNFKTGISKISLERPAVLGDGILPLSKEVATEYAEYFEKKKHNFKLEKFVPASGAATRMFKFLHEFLANYNPEKETINGYINRKKDTNLEVFLLGLERFPFYEEIAAAAEKGIVYPDADNENVREDARNYNFIKTMMGENGFDYANKPKGILPFHKYDHIAATPVYEHLREAAAYAESQGKTHVHFTISENHLDGFLDSINEARSKVEEETGVKISFDFTYQQKETDTIAVDMQNRPFRDSKLTLLFRPGGHGALIENLNMIDADIVFVKNIDNVRHTKMETIALYKNALAGMLAKLQEKVFYYLNRIENHEASEAELDEILDFATDKLMQDISPDFDKFTVENKFLTVKELLNRPIRVCGMVKNEGEPGGGPFWVKGNKGRLSLQIVESSQIDLDNKIQSHIFSQSTHFNPVDIVCGLKDYKGNRFDLPRYVDPNTGFIVTKNRMGVDVKSYELPGLWNGAMAGWITVFAEVPLKTFNPVKTVNDLLKPAHQKPV